MKLLDVKVVLDRDKGIQQAGHKSEVMKKRDDTTTRYAILSHRWGLEVNYEEIIGLMKMEEEEREEVKQRYGYQKIIKGCEQAMKDGYEWLWIDTCCIDIRSSAELSEAINSIYRWYQNAQICYTHLYDVSESTFPIKEDVERFWTSNGWPEWFVRGWTLQELIAPKEVEFFNRDWVHIGSRRQLASTLERITGIPSKGLTSGLARKHFSVAQIMSWAARRRTTRVEDRAYSLMGLFGVNMPMLYGEGKKAFQRLQLEIIRVSNDQSIFAWRSQMPRTGSVLAEDPSDFEGCGKIRSLEPDEFVDRLIGEYIVRRGLSDSSPNDIDRRALHQRKLAALREGVESQQFHMFTVSNVGIQMFLPVVPSHDSPRSHSRAILACSRLPGIPITIDLVSSGRSFARTSIDSLLPATYPEFKVLHLIYHQDTTFCEFALGDKNVLYHGFTRCGTYPREFAGTTVTLSSPADDLIVIVYANHDAQSYFAVGLGHYLGQGWVHIDYYDGHPPTQVESWMDFGRGAYDRMWKVRAKLAQSMPKRQGPYTGGHGDYFVKHAHLPRSIWAAKVVWGGWEANDFKVIIDVVKCPGCCHGPYGMMTTSNDRADLATSGLMDTISDSYSLELDNQLAWFDGCYGKGIVLGDYGDYSHGNLARTGNIFEDMRTAGIDREDSAYCPVVSHVSDSGFARRMGWTKNQDDLAVAYQFTGKIHLALRQPKAILLPTNEYVSLLLKALSTRLAGKYLVTTIICCSHLYRVDEDGNRRDSGTDSVRDDGDFSTEARVLTPLCTIASPHVWNREPLCEQRKERFKSIREHFYALVNMHQPLGTESSPKSVNRRVKDIPVKFFSGLFGLDYLKKYIGKMNVLERFPLTMENSPVSDVPSTGAAEENGLRVHPPKLSWVSLVMRYNPLRGSRQFAAAELDPHVEVLLPQLHKLCQTLCGEYDVPRQYADERQRVEGDMKSISQTLGSDLLKYVMTTFRNAYSKNAFFTEETGQVSHLQYDRQFSTPAVVQDIMALQVKLNAAKDEDEQRALEEDITGKILWLFWCGICTEVEELLPKVVNYIQSRGSIEGLWRISWVTPPTELCDDQEHLQRIMLDAGENTSKYHLWLDALAQAIPAAERLVSHT